MTARDPAAARPLPPIEKVTREVTIWAPPTAGGRFAPRTILMSLPRVKFLERPSPRSMEQGK